MRHSRFDPFSVRPREDGAVGALRRQAAGVDTATVSRRRHPAEPGTGIVDLGTVARTFGHMGEPTADA